MYIRNRMTTKKITDIKKLLATPQNIVIIPHRNGLHISVLLLRLFLFHYYCLMPPFQNYKLCYKEGDAIGSSLALYHYLKNKHYVTVVAPNDYPEFLKWMPSSDEVKLFDKQNKQSILMVMQLARR